MAPPPRVLALLLPLLPLASASYFNHHHELSDVLHARWLQARADEVSSNLTASVSGGAQQFVQSGIISQSDADQIVQALQPQIRQASVVISADPDATSVSPDDKADTTTVVTKTGAEVTVSSVTLVATPTTGNDTTAAALQDIGQSVGDALAALDLARSQANLTSLSDLASCFKAIFSAGGLTADAECVTKSGSTPAGLTNLFNTVLEQFVGILPNKVVNALQGATSPILTGLLPAEQSFNANIDAAFKSVTASMTGNLVTAVELAQQCFTQTAAQSGNVQSANCFVKAGGAYSAYQNALKGAVEQFMGVLPPNVLNDTLNIYSYYTATTDPSTAAAQKALNNALQSVVASVSGSTVTYIEQLQTCMNKIIQSSDPPSYVSCLTSSSGNPLSTINTATNVMAEAFGKYLPDQVLSILTTTGNKFADGNISSAESLAYQDQVKNIFANYRDCILSIQNCVVNNILTKSSSTCTASTNACNNISTAKPATPAPACPKAIDISPLAKGKKPVQPVKKPVVKAAIVTPDQAKLQVVKQKGVVRRG